MTTWYDSVEIDNIVKKYNLPLKFVETILSRQSTTVIKLITPENYIKVFALLFKYRPNIATKLFMSDFITSDQLFDVIDYEPTILSCLTREIEESEKFISSLQSRFKKSYFDLVTNRLILSESIFKIFPEEVAGARARRVFCEDIYDKYAKDGAEYYASFQREFIINKDVGLYRYLPSETWDNPEMQDLAVDVLLSRAKKDPYSISHLSSVFQSDVMIEKIAEKIDISLYEKLPRWLKNDKRIKTKYEENKKKPITPSDKYNSDWKNKKGEVIEYFTLNNGFKITSKLDYLKIYKEYLESKMTIPNFCASYGISSESGFRNMIAKLKDEEVKLDTSKSKNEINENTRKEIIHDLAIGKISIDDFLQRYRLLFNSCTLDEIRMDMTHEEHISFAGVLLEYVSKLTPYITNEFMDFIRFDIVAHNSTFTTFVRTSGILRESKDYDRLYLECNKKLKTLEKTCSRSELKCSYIVGGKTYEIDDEIIDQAYIYLRNHNMYISHYTVSNICKKLASKEIDYTKEVDSYKEEMASTVLQLLQEKKTIDDYLSMMKES